MNQFSKNLIKKALIIFGIILAILFIYFGSYLPMAKAKRYIQSLQAARNVKSVEEFKNNLDSAFNFYSPIGGEELAKFSSNDILGIIGQKSQPEEVSRTLVNYIEPKMHQNNVRHLLAVGQMYYSLWNNYGKKEDDFKKSEDYYLKAFEIGPKLPPVLYGILNLYQQKGDQANLERIAGIIISYWPNQN